MNTSLTDIMNGTNHQIEKEGLFKDDEKKLKEAQVFRENLKEAFEIVIDILSNKRQIYSILIEKRI